MNFCPGCGRAVSKIAANTTVSTTIYENGIPVSAYKNVAYLTDPEGSIYALLLLNRGSCSVPTTCDLLEDFLGYTPQEAQEIIANLPCQITQSMDAEQTRYIAHAFSEYGMHLQVFNQVTKQPVDFGNSLTNSLFDQLGNLVPAALGILATLSSSNRVTTFARYDLPYAPRPYTLGFRRSVPVPHMRRCAPPPKIKAPSFQKPL